ncbi:MAG: GNAT family N-acetyltransferase [Geminicoccaceae bacterium]
MPLPHPPEPFITERLKLRRPVLADASAIFEAYAQDQDVVRFLSWQAHTDEEQTRQFLEQSLTEWASGNSFPYVMQIRRQGADPVGMLHARPKGHLVEFGYVLARDYWGRGYMSEALAALADWYLAQPSIWRASAVCDVDNLASARVMEKAGFQFEGVLRRFFRHPNISPEPRDCKIFAQTKCAEFPNS